MNVIEIPLEQLREAPWNPNSADPATLIHLAGSISRFGLVVPLVVRVIDNDTYQVLSGNQRLQVLQGLGCQQAPCIVTALADADAMLMAQALNQIHGSDDLGAKAELIRTVLRFIPQAAVLSILPESTDSLAALIDLGQIDIAQHLQGWQAAQAARLRHLTFQLAGDQRDVVDQAIDRAAEEIGPNDDNPNPRGNALHAICRAYLKERA